MLLRSRRMALVVVALAFPATASAEPLQEVGQRYAPSLESVTCGESGDYPISGAVGLTTSLTTIWLHRVSVCRPLRRQMRGLRTWNDRLAFGLMIFAHELEHVRDITASEAEVQCRALAGWPRIARAIHVERARMRRLRPWVRALSAELPEQYQMACP
jgi:hypothetical protein